MAFSRVLRPFLATIVIACTALVANAQPGPIGGPKQGGKQPAPTGKISPERVADLLKTKVQANADGSKTIAAMVNQDGWQFEVIVVFLPDGKVFDIYSPLSGPNPKLTPAQLQGLEQKNQQMKAEQKAFTINPQDNRLYFANINFLTNCSEQQFAQALAAHCATIRDSYDLWKQQ